VIRNNKKTRKKVFKPCREAQTAQIVDGSLLGTLGSWCLCVKK
jgi:hypothetical protein